VKMHEKRYESKVVSKNVNALHDINFILGSLAFVLCLNVCMHWSTLHKTRLCLCAIFLKFIKLAQQKLYWLYYDPFAKYEDETFDYFNSIEALTNDSY
jgi:hypothetical protein